MKIRSHDQNFVLPASDPRGGMVTNPELVQPHEVDLYSWPEAVLVRLCALGCGRQCVVVDQFQESGTIRFD
jgi:hypothetical protein